MLVHAVHHIQTAIPMGGEEKARQFYGTLLGLQEVPKPPNLQGRGGLWFCVGDIQVHLGVDPMFIPATKAHVAFACRHPEEVRARLVESGFTIVEDEPLSGFDRFYTSDPFGNRVELLSPVES